MKSHAARTDLARRTVRKFAAAAKSTAGAGTKGGKGKGGKGGKGKSKTGGTSATGALGRNYGTRPVPLELLKAGKVKVIDRHGSWMAEWHKNFAAYRIPHLRSAADVHPGPHDMRELLAYAHLTHRNLNEYDMVNMVAMKRDTVFKGPYTLPSTSIFRDYCGKLIKTYAVEDAVNAGEVAHVRRHSSDLYELELSGGEVVRTKRVVCALGPNLRKDLMFWEHPLGTAGVDYKAGTLVHAFELSDWLLDFAKRMESQAELPRPRVVVVGGGITSSHVVRVMMELGCSPVTLLVRSELREKQFDIPKKWFGPQRGKLLAEYDQMPVAERMSTFKDARGGGSMPPESMHFIGEAVEKGALVIHEGQQISSAVWVGTATDGHWRLEMDSEMRALECDIVLLASGADLDTDQYPILKDMLAQVPIETYDGFPVLQPNLSWAKGENFYIMGALAALALGPDALNLAGARHGACRIARALRQEMAGTC